MSLLTDDEIEAICKELWLHPKKLYRALEAAIIAKLASAELPEPAMLTHGAIDTTEKPWFTADQLRQAYAQGAASQLSEEPIAFTDVDFGMLCVARDIASDCGATVELFTLKEPK